MIDGKIITSSDEPIRRMKSLAQDMLFSSADAKKSSDIFRDLPRASGYR